MKRSILLNGRQVDYDLQRKKVRNINLRIHPNGEINISAPRYVSDRYIESFLLSKADFILSALQRAENAAPCFEYKDGDELPFLGLSRKLKLIQGSENRVWADWQTLFMQITDTENTVLKQKTVEEFYKRQSAEIIPRICEEVYPHFQNSGVTFPTIRFRRMKRSWGSCMPGKNAVTFNTLLSMADMECIKFVAVHEFCHFIHPNHSADFYRCLDSALPGWREQKQKLTLYSRWL